MIENDYRNGGFKGLHFFSLPKCNVLNNIKQMSNLENRIKSFLEGYNSLLEELNDELSGIEDMTLNRKVKNMSSVKVGNVELDECLYEEYCEILLKI